jgi:hypothetical protein
MKANRQITPKAVLQYYHRKHDAIIKNIDKMTEQQVENALHNISRSFRIDLWRMDYEIQN